MKYAQHLLLLDIIVVSLLTRLTFSFSIAGFSLACFILCATLFSNRTREATPYYLLVFLQTILVFLAKIVAPYASCEAWETFLVYENFLFGIPPLYLLFRRSFARPDERVWRHFLPAIVNTAFAVAVAVLGFRSSATELPLASGASWRDLVPFAYRVLLSLGESIQLVVYVILGAVATRWNRQLKERATLLAFYIVIFCGYLSYYALFWAGSVARIAGRAPGFLAAGNPAWVDFLLVLSTLLYTPFVGLIALSNATRPSAVSKAKYGGMVLEEGEARRILSSLRAYLAQRDDLSATATNPRNLAKALRVPYYLLSRAVNEYEKRTVADVIREYRLRRAKEILDHDDEIKIVDVALDSGFSAKSSFNEAFRTQYGLTPSEYRRQARGEVSTD